MHDPRNINPEEIVDRLIEDAIDRFEHARWENEDVDVAQFMPAIKDRHFDEIGTELLRVDLQYSWKAGQPTEIRNYQTRFPKLLGKTHNLEELAYEEYRMRRLAGQQVDPAEYASRFSIETDAWPCFGDSTVNCNSPEATTFVEPVRPVAVDDTDYQHGETELGAEELGNKQLGDKELGQEHTRSRTATSDIPDVGDSFNDFELMLKLGRGAFGTVFLARQESLANRLVVLKISRMRVDVESQILARLQHTNIVPINSAHQEGALQGLCMPYFGPCTLQDVTRALHRDERIPRDGNFLRQVIQARSAEVSAAMKTVDETAGVAAKSTIGESTAKPAEHDESQTHASTFQDRTYVDSAIQIILQCARGLSFAHQQGYVHCDLKPANILLADHRQVMLLDFNLSGQSTGDASRSLVGGTLPYLAPEQLNSILSGRRVPPSADIYSLGAILYELLTGRVPFPLQSGSSSSDIARLVEHREHRPTAVRELNPHVPASVSAMVGRLLEPKAEDRYASMHEICEDLERHLDQRLLRHVANPMSERFGKWRRRHPRLGSIVSLLVMATGLILGMLFMWMSFASQQQQLQDVANLHRASSDLQRLRAYVGTPDASTDRLLESVELSRLSIAPFFQSNSDGESSLRSKIAQKDEVRRVVSEHLYLAANAAHRLSGLPVEDSNVYEDEAIRLNVAAVEVGYSPNLPALKHQAKRFAGKADGAIHFPQGNYAADTMLDAFEQFQAKGPVSTLDTFKSLRDQHPHDPSVWILLGHSYQATRKFGEARLCYRTALGMWPDSVFTKLMLANHFVESAEYRQAKTLYDEIIESKPGYVAAHINRAQALRGLRDYPAAVTDLTRALQLDSRQTRIYFERADLYAQLGRQSDAQADVEAGLSKTPSDAKSWIRRGIANFGRDDQQALSDLQEALKLNPKSHAAKLNMAYVLADRLGRIDDSIKVLNEMIAELPVASEIMSRGVYHGRMGNVDEALTDVERALKLRQDVRLLFQAGCVMAQVSKKDPDYIPDAIAYLRRAIVNEPQLKKLVDRDPDLEPIRDTNELKKLMRELDDAI